MNKRTNPISLTSETHKILSRDVVTNGDLSELIDVSLREMLEGKISSQEVNAISRGMRTKISNAIATYRFGQCNANGMKVMQVGVNRKELSDGNS